jgi:hypothetical protein
MITDDPLSSDHFPIILTLSKGTQPGSKNEKRRLNTSKVDWSMFTELIEGSFNESVSGSFLDVKEPYKFLYSSIENSIKEASYSSRKNKEIPRSSPPWWDAECSEVVANRKEAMRNYR